MKGGVTMVFRHMGKKFLFNSRSNFKGYRADFLKNVLAAAKDKKIAGMIKAELDSRKGA